MKLNMFQTQTQVVILKADIGAQETVELPAIQAEQPDPEKENQEREDIPVTDTVELPAIPVEQLNPETLDNPVTDKVEPPAIPVEKPNPETMDNPMTDKVEHPQFQWNNRIQKHWIIR